MLQSLTIMKQFRFCVIHMSLVILLSLAACNSEAAPEATTPTEATSSLQSLGFQNEAGPEGVRNYTRVDATIACAGATPPGAMADLRTRGFNTVINFRTSGERGASVDAGRTAAEAAGLRYVHLPFRDPTNEIVESFLQTVADPVNQPVYIHCGSANRVGAMWLIKRVVQDGYSVENATAEAEAIGLSSAGLRNFALDYVRSEP